MPELGINYHNLFTTDDAAHIQPSTSIIGVLIIYEQVYDQMTSTKVFPLLLQKLEEFLFCMEENHPEVGNLNALTGCHFVIEGY